MQRHPSHHGLSKPAAGDPRLISPFKPPLQRQNATTDLDSLAAIALPILSERDASPPQTQKAEESEEGPLILEDLSASEDQTMDSESSEEEDREGDFRSHVQCIIENEGLETAKAWFSLEVMKYKKPRKEQSLVKSSKRLKK
ncbi:hypothetical protein [Crucivirus-534]|nr:hypothetical protein [Crucivirus-534]